MPPLRGVRVVEMAGLAPSPFCGMILADFGASVTVVNRTSPTYEPDVLSRGKRSIALDLKRPEGVAVVRAMCKNADVLIEPFRAGVMERMKLGPDELLEDNPSLIYARLTGYGQSGPHARRAGHDINYLALSGLLSRLGRKDEKPSPPINLLADFAGGGLMCAMGIMAALLDRTKTGRGQLIDANMVEGAAYLGSWVFKTQDTPIFGNPRGENLLDSGAHNYDTFRTKDGMFMAVGSLEPQFYAALLQGLGIAEEDDLPVDMEDLKRKISEVFLTRTRDEWATVFEEIDACVTPVLELDEAKTWQHHVERGAFAKSQQGQLDPIPAPRLLSSMPDPSSIVSRRCPVQGEDTREVLAEIGFGAAAVEDLIEKGAVKCAATRSKL